MSIETAKALAIVIGAQIAAILSPSLFTLIIFGILWSVDLIVGSTVSEVIQGERFQMKKVGVAFLALLIISGIIAFISVIGYFQRLNLATTQKFCEYVGWVCNYVYCVNILKNFRRCLPHNQFLLWLEWLIRVDIVRKTAILKRFNAARCEKDDTKMCDKCGECDAK